MAVPAISTTHALYTPPELWLQGLRTNDYARCMALVTNPVALLKEVQRVVSNTMVATLVCRALHVDGLGTLAEVQQRVAAHPMVVFLLLAARFSVRKRRAAIADVVRGVLSEEAQRACCYETADGDIGEPDRVAALIQLYVHDPQSLRMVRALHLWHSSAAAAWVLDDQPMGVLPRQGLDRFVLHDPAFRGALDAMGVRFEGLFARDNGQWLLFVSHNYKEGCLWMDGEVRHGHVEELVVLDFQEGGRAVCISSKSKPSPVAIANAIASAFFGRPCTYTPDLASSASPAVQAFMARVLDPHDDTLPLVDADVSRVPGLPGAPGMALYRANGGRMEEALQTLEHQLGDLTRYPEQLRRFHIRYDEATIGLYVRRGADGDHVVQFADGRTNNHRAAQFQAAMQEQYGIAVRSARTSKA